MRNFNAFKTEPSDEAPLGAKPLEAIGRALRAHYDDLLREPLPARFDDLLSRLAAGDVGKTSGEPPAPKTE